jgi:hypothetical protein
MSRRVSGRLHNFHRGPSKTVEPGTPPLKYAKHIMPSSNATGNKRRKWKRAQETLYEKEQRRLERRQKYAARDPETILSQSKRRNERDRQTYAAMDKDKEELREILKRERGELNCWDEHHPRLN